MKYNILINQQKSIEWGLTLSEAVVFNWIYSTPSWAEQAIIDGDTFYFASRIKCASDLPIVSDKSDTIYRIYKSLESKGIIEIKKIGIKDYVSLTKIGKTWEYDIEEELGKKSEHSEKNPTFLGKKSENDSEKNPTYTNIILDNNIKDNSVYADFEKSADTHTPEVKKQRKKKTNSVIDTISLSESKRFYDEQVIVANESSDADLCYKYKQFVSYIWEKNPTNSPVEPMLILKNQLSYEQFKELFALREVSKKSIKDAVDIGINTPSYWNKKTSVFLTLKNWIKA